MDISHHEVSAGYSPVYDEATFEDKRSIREYFNVIYKRLPIIFTMMILTTAAVAFYMYRQPSVYQAQAGMIIEPRKPKVTSKDAININFGNDVNYFQTQLLLLQSPELMRDTMVRLGLHRQPDLLGDQNKGVWGTLRSMFSSDKNASEKKSSTLPTLTESTAESADGSDQIILTPEEKERAERYAGIFLNNLTVLQVDRTNLVNVQLQSTNPQLAAQVANTMAKIFIEQDRERETQGAKKSYEDLSKSIDDLKTTISSQEQALIREQDNSGLPLSGEKGQDLNAGILQQLSSQLLTAKNERRDLEAKYAAAQRANANGEIFATQGDNEAVQNMRQQLAERKAKLDDREQEVTKQIQEKKATRSNMLANWTEEHPKVIAITQEIGQLEKTLSAIKKENSGLIDQEENELKQKVAREVLTGLRAQLESARKREVQLEGAFNTEVASANRQGVATTRLTTLMREIDTNRTLLDTYIQRQKEQELAISTSLPDNVKISTEAQVPDSPIGPKRNRNILVAFLISLAAGIGLAFLLDYLDDSVRNSDDIGRNLGLPTLALIPFQNISEKRKLSLLPGKNGHAGQSTALITMEDNRSPMAEAYRHLRTSLLFSSAGKPPQTILVTSSQPAEGKTTTAINTAITLAQSGADVVIIDCDLRRPRLHNHFSLENGNGLTNYLSGEKNPENLLKPFPSLPNLKIITSGPIPPNPAELLSSNEMKNLLQFLKGNFKHVIIDSPPAISFTDAAILSTLVDGVVLVALAGKSSIHLMRRFKQRLGNIGARIYGVVLNGIRANSVEYGYYGYGYYNYYSRNEDDSTPLMEQAQEGASIHDTKE
ncbi:MAG: polysaccharide biosynthesis tyrosine autokinase [Pyrinomonadaceae bacterium]